MATRPKSLAALFLITSVLRGADVQLAAKPTSIQAGQSVVLSWRVQGASHAFLSEVGEVNIEGSRTVSPKQTTQYALAVELPSGVVLSRVTVKVRGHKGSEEFPPDDQFSFPVSTSLTTSFEVFLAHTHRVLQDNLKFYVREFPERDRFIFITNLSARRDLIKYDDPAIGAWLIAYRVEVQKPGRRYRQITYTAQALIKYRRKLDERIYPLSNSTVTRDSIDALRMRLERGD